MCDIRENIRALRNLAANVRRHSISGSQLVAYVNVRMSAELREEPAGVRCAIRAMCQDTATHDIAPDALADMLEQLAGDLYARQRDVG